MSTSKFNRLPAIPVTNSHTVWNGWDDITGHLRSKISAFKKKVSVVAVEYYPGVLEDELNQALTKGIQPILHIQTQQLFFKESDIQKMVYPDVTDDRIFGFHTRLTIDAFFDPEKIEFIHSAISSIEQGIVLITGPGAAYVTDNFDLLIYADMARWEIQLRMRQHLVDNLGVKNKKEPDWMLLYKQAFFVDWRVCDRWKKKLINRWDYLLDTNQAQSPKMVTGQAIREGLEECLQQPFSLVPFFDPGPWGGQWMKKHCDLDKSSSNYAWCFNCVPEENSLLLKFGHTIIELPAIDLVFYKPEELMGNAVYGRFGDEFPIRFDYLDTIEGGNLSLQVHPLTQYIQEKFGMHYTQDESYYMMEAKPEAVVYLGLRNDIDPEAMIEDLEKAQKGEIIFDAEKHVQSWPVKKHDHFLIPAGTVHCSGKESMVLEISATPYIFTFKLWDWGRLGIDGKPRPINIEHGKQNIQWNRVTDWTKNNLVNQIEKIAEGDGWIEEKTGLHELEFIETRRHWFTKEVPHHTEGTVHVLCLVEGDEIVVESPAGKFKPFVVHYAETCVIPAIVGEYTTRPSGSIIGQRCATMKAFVRSKS